MSGIKAGKYIIRKEPSGPYGGMYATRQEEVDLPVVLGAQVPDLIHRQYAGDTESHWRITSFPSGSAATTILSTEDPSGGPHGPVMALFIPIDANAEGGGAGPDEKLWQQWRITPVDVPGVTNTYTLQPVTKFLGMNWYVGVKDNELYIQAFDIRDDSPKPYWRFDFITEAADNAA